MIATCPHHDLLRNYANGLVSEEQADELTSHLRDCPSCQNWLAEPKNVDDTLVGSLRHSTVDQSFDLEPQCQSAMAIALGALATADQESSEHEIDLPSSIGEYEIVRRIGRGGMGNVYLAQHTKLNRSVAVKVLASHRLSDPRMHERFDKEMRAIGSLSHPNIVTAHDARDVDGVALLVTEWVDGLDLKDLLARTGPLSVANACEIGVRIASALSYIAEQRLVHRDLKPSNIMIDREGEVKLLDLGLARLRAGDAEPDISGATETGQAMGTADYISPEQINDAREVDIRADIYGLGCTLYKLLSGNAPFESDDYTTTFAKLTAHVSEQPTSLRAVAPHVPAQVAKLVDQMLAKSPDDRPASPGKIAGALQKHANNSDLRMLVQSAFMTEPSSSQQRETAPISAPQTETFWKRRVPIALAIATGFGGLILGWLAGVTITITHPDGSKTSIEAPKTSHVTVDQNGNVDLALAGPPSTKQATELANPMVGSVHPANTQGTPNFDGVWKAVAVEQIGDDLSPTQKIDNVSFAIHGNKYVLYRGPKSVASGTFTAAAPNLITLMRGEAAAIPVNAGRYRINRNGSVSLRFAAPVVPDEPAGDRNKYTLLFSRLITPEQFQTGLPSHHLTDIPDLSFPAYAYTHLSRGNPIDSIAGSRPDDHPRFEGIWAAKSGMHRGRDAPIPNVENVAIVFHKRKFVVVRRSRPLMGGTFEIDSDLNRITLKSVDQETPSDHKGLYRFRNEGQLELFLQSPNSADYPIAFDSPRSTNASTISFSKVDLPPLSNPIATADFLRHHADQDLVYWVAMYSQIDSGVPVDSLVRDTLAVNKAYSVSKSKNNLKELGIAFHNYHATHGAFPMSKGSVGNGKLKQNEYPCSWRVAILPFIGQTGLYDQYKFDQPWDGEDNRKLLDKMPEVYRRPGGLNGSTDTSYVGFAGTNTILGDQKPTKMRDTIDGTSNTLMLVEAATKIPWTKPEDFTLDQIADTGLLENESLLVALADGSIRELKPVTAEFIRGAATINDGQYLQDVAAPANSIR